MTVPILDAPIRHWRCPDCSSYASTQRPDIHTEFHNCPAQGNLGIPLVEVDTPDSKADARHIPVIGEKGVLTSIGTHHGNGRVDRTVIL